jgi:hypothetical protein
MSEVVNWKKIGLFAVALFLAEVLVGFIAGGVEAAEKRLAMSLVLSLSFSILLFSVMAAGQSRPFLHTSLSLLLNFVFSLVLWAILPAWLVETPLILAALEWLTLTLGLVIGTSIGCYIGFRRVRTDA